MTYPTLEALANIDHPYYCSDSNWHSNDANQHYATFEDFIAEYGEADVDYNLVFRWDIKEWSEGEYTLHIYIIQQRKGRFTPIFVDSIKDEHVPQLFEYLKAHAARLLDIWNPVLLKDPG